MERRRKLGMNVFRLRSIITICPVTSLLLFATGCFSGNPTTAQADAASREKEPVRCVTLEEADRLADQVLQLVNLERATANLSPVVWNRRLEKIAGDYACRMIEEDFFGHHDPINGRSPGDRALAGKYAFYCVGENLAAGQESAADVMKVWMESPSHRQIILDPSWKEVAIAVRSGGKHSIYWVMEFGDPANFLDHETR